MRDAVELVNLIKQVAVNAVGAGKPAEIVFGRVTSTSPLQIVVDQKMILGKNQLILSQRVTEHKVSVTVDWHTEDAAAHSHSIEGKVDITVHSELDVGDEVMLIRQQGGQKYIVSDRIG